MTRLDPEIEPTEQVPHWCGFFDPAGFAEFCAAVDDACSCFGAGGQELWSGSVELAAGAWGEICPFPLPRLAARCQHADRADWTDLCWEQVDAWVTGAGQYGWLERAGLDQVRDRIMVRAGTGCPRFSGTTRDDPDEFFQRQLAAGLWLGLVVEQVPTDQEDEPELDVQLPNRAVRAWVADPDELVSIGLANLAAAPPDWREISLAPAPADRGWPVPPAPAATALVGSGPGAGAWAGLLAAAFPALREVAALVAVPNQDTILVCLDPPREGWPELARALARRATAEYFDAEGETVVSDGVYWYRQGSFEVCVPPSGQVRREMTGTVLECDDD